MSPIHRKIILFSILGGVAALVFLDPAFPPEDDSISLSAPSLPAQNATAVAVPEVKPKPGALPQRTALSEPVSELFGSMSWQPPPPKAAPPAPPPPPPMPYRFAGKLLHNGKLQVFLSKGDGAIPISDGQVLDGIYRIEAIEDTQITLTYLPLTHKEIIPVRSSLKITAASTAPAGAPAAAGPAQAAAATITSGAAATPVPDTVSVLKPATAVAAATGPKTGSKQVRFLWEGPPRVRIGAAFSVTLRASSEQAVHAAPMQLKFDPKLLEAVTVKAGKFFGLDNRNFSYRINPDGAIFVGASNQGAAPAFDAELLVLTFKPLKATSTTEISIASLNLQGSAGGAIAYDLPVAFKTAITP